MADKQVSFEIKAGVTGEQSITALADDLEDVAKLLGDDLSKQAQAAAARLRELAEQNAAINNFERLQSEARAAAKALKEAEKEAANYAAQVGKNAVMTRQEADGLVQLQARVRGAKDAYTQSNAALKDATSELTRYGISTKNTGDVQQRLRAEVAQVRESVQGLAPAYQQASAGAASAGAEMVRTHRQVGEGVRSISEQLQNVQKLYASFLALSGAAHMVRGLAETADAFKNLQARIQLATGEGQAFTDAFAEVGAIALRTHSALEATGTLFQKLTEAGKSAGLATQEAIAQSLSLTETINQAVQLSGGSAESANAALTQLIQGFQSGVLRGDEFNSVMEQSPRLAKALADGLGVTTGELRKMAEAGALTSDTVVAALRAQSDVVQAEFSKLPATVGRALTDLNTAWTVYIGNADQASGASAAAAQAIELLSTHLAEVIDLLYSAGKAAAAFAALRLAQQFIGLASAAQGAGAAVAAANTQIAASGAVAATAAASVGRFAALLRGLRTFSLIGIATNFQEIGTWIGEASAKLMGYKDRTEELARAEKRQAEIAKEAAADRARLAAATQAAIDKQFELSKATRTAVASFAQLTKEGASAAEAVKKITENFDLTRVQGIQDFAATLDKLAADGKISAGEFQAAWAQALSGKDLAQFEVTARTAFAGTAREGERLAQMMDAVLREAVKRTGLEFAQLQGSIGSAARSAINDVEAITLGLAKLKAEGVDTGRALTASITKAINTADSQAAIDSLVGRIKLLRSELGDKITDGLLDQAKQKADALKDALDAATPGINSVREAMKALGVTSDEELKRVATSAKEAYDTLVSDGTRSARELQEAFKKAAQAAIDANQGVAPVWVQAAAAMRGFELEADKAGNATLRLKSATDQASDAHKRAANAVDQHRTALEQLNAEKEREISAQEKALDLAERAAAVERKKRNIDKQGYALDKDGNRLQQAVPYQNYVLETAKSQGLSEAAAVQLLNQFFQNGRAIKPGGDASRDWFSAVNRAVSDRAVQETLQRVQGSGANASTGATYVSNITIDGQRTSLNFSDAESQRQAEALLRRLGDDKRRAA